MDIFCKIIKKEIPAYIVYETPETLAFLDVTPSSPGHTVVILKKHGNNILEYTPDELGIVMKSVQEVAKKIEKALSPDSITIGINHKEPKGVPHLHIHLIPRWINDGGHAIQGVVNKKLENSLEELSKKLNSA